MIHWISVSNYQSIRDEITLDFRVPGTTPDKAWLRRPTSQRGCRVPTVIALVGPNGAGKTAWLRALADTMRFAVHSYGNPPGVTGNFPAFASDAAFTKPTRIEVEFDAPWWAAAPDEPNRVFRYTLELRRGTPGAHPDAVGYEALRDFPRGRPRRLMERRPHRRVHVARDLSIKPGDDRLASIPANASVLSTLSRMGVGKVPEIVDSLSRVQTSVSALDTGTVINHFRDNPQVKERISDRLGRFDLGIEGMEVERGSDGTWRMAFSHSGLAPTLPFELESAGTRHVVHVLPSLDHALETGGPALVDALDNDLHADLVNEILGWFRREDTNPGNAQLICSLHGLSALDELDKEELVVVEKDRSGATRAFSAREVQGVRRTGSLRKIYRSGALGGLPSFG